MTDRISLDAIGGAGCKASVEVLKRGHPDVLPNGSASVTERLREAEKLLGEILNLANHLERTDGTIFLTVDHENRIRKFLCLLPRGAEHRPEDEAVEHVK
jgi:hypothetical protein